MNRLLAASAALTLAATLPAHAGGSPPRHTITAKNNTGYPMMVFFYNNDDAIHYLEASRLQLFNGQSGSGSCNTNGSCDIVFCIDLGQQYATSAVIGSNFTHCQSGGVYGNVITNNRDNWSGTCFVSGPYSGGGGQVLLPFANC